MLTGLLALSVPPTLFGLAGAWLIYRTHASRVKASTIEDTESVEVGSVADGDEVAKVEGTARSTGDLVTATLLDEEGVVVTTTIERRDQTGDGSGFVWKSIHESVDSGSFVVDDGTGEIAVEVSSDADVTLYTQTSGSEQGDKPSGRAQQLVVETDEVDPNVDEARQFEQGVVEDGEDVVVIGEPKRQDGGLVLGGGSDLVVSDKSVADLAAETSGGFLGYVAGGFLTFVGLGGLSLLWL